jgi:hypothetical protein
MGKAGTSRPRGMRQHLLSSPFLNVYGIRVHPPIHFLRPSLALTVQRSYRDSVLDRIGSSGGLE